MAIGQDEIRVVQIEVWTEKLCIHGSVHIPQRGGYKGRLSDLLNKSESHFLSLTDVTISSLDRNERLWQGKFLALNKAGVVLVKALKE